jgi:diacylglycerol kinase (ATP)
MIEHKLDARCQLYDSNRVVLLSPLGNDFSRATGWGAAMPFTFSKSNIKPLKTWLKDILTAEVFNFDLWNVKIELDEDTGSFGQIKENSLRILKHKVLGDNGELVDANLTVMNKMCCNYFSTGVESRIGFGFEKRRTKSQALNKFFYGTESLKKLLFKKHVRINDYVKKLTYENDGKMVVIDPKKSFLSNPISLIFQNIPSMIAGCDFWNGSYKYADKEISESNAATAIVKRTDNLLLSKQEIGDGKIELMTIKNLMNYSRAQAGMIKGVAKRVAQARGPFLIEFEERYDDKIYFQVDGESFFCINPTSIALRHTKNYRILVKKGSKLTKTSVQSKISEATSQERNGNQYTRRTMPTPTKADSKRGNLNATASARQASLRSAQAALFADENVDDHNYGAKVADGRVKGQSGIEKGLIGSADDVDCEEGEGGEGDSASDGSDVIPDATSPNRENSV